MYTHYLGELNHRLQDDKSITCRNKKQDEVAKSTAEAEYRALSSACNEVV